MYGYPRHPYYGHADLRHPHYGHEAHYAGISTPGLIFPPVGIYEFFRDAGQGGAGSGGGGGGGHRDSGGGGGGGGGGSSHGRSSGSFDWSLLAKASIFVGGALAIYAIYKASTIARPINEEMGSVATKYLLARGGKGVGTSGKIAGLLGAGGAARSTILPSEPARSSIEVQQVKA